MCQYDTIPHSEQVEVALQVLHTFAVKRSIRFAVFTNVSFHCFELQYAQDSYGFKSIGILYCGNSGTLLGYVYLPL